MVVWKIFRPVPLSYRLFITSLCDHYISRQVMKHQCQLAKCFYLQLFTSYHLFVILISFIIFIISSIAQKNTIWNELSLQCHMHIFLLQEDWIIHWQNKNDHVAEVILISTDSTVFHWNVKIFTLGYPIYINFKIWYGFISFGSMLTLCITYTNNNNKLGGKLV